LASSADQPGRGGCGHPGRLADRGPGRHSGAGRLIGRQRRALGRGLLRVQEIADQVHLVSNRATLIALNAAIAGARLDHPEPETDELSNEMKRLATEVRTATERTAVLSREIEGEVSAAVERMRGVRQRVAEQLEAIPAHSGSSPASRCARRAVASARAREGDGAGRRPEGRAALGGR